MKGITHNFFFFIIWGIYPAKFCFFFGKTKIFQKEYWGGGRGFSPFGGVGGIYAHYPIMFDILTQIFDISTKIFDISTKIFEILIEIVDILTKMFQNFKQKVRENFSILTKVFEILAKMFEILA